MGIVVYLGTVSDVRAVGWYTRIVEYSVLDPTTTSLGY